MVNVHILKKAGYTEEEVPLMMFFFQMYDWDDKKQAWVRKEAMT